MQRLKDDTSQKEQRNIVVKFKRLDSLNYSIDIVMVDGPCPVNNGFYKLNNFYYWLKGELPSNIIWEKGPKKRFKDKYIPIFSWEYEICKVVYNSHTGEIKLIESNP